MQGKNRWALLAGPLFALAVGCWLTFAAEIPRPAMWCAVITTLCGFWWIFEPIPMPVTALIPMAAFPLVGHLEPS